MRDDTDRPRDGKDPSTFRVLRLVHPSPPKPPRRPPAVRPPLFTAEEEGRLKVAFRNARVLFGTWDCLADAMCIPSMTVQRAVFGKKKHVSPDLAIRLSKALGVPLEALYGAPIRIAGQCPTCGARRAP